MNMDPELITAADAAHRLHRQPATMRRWVERYGARQYNAREHGIPSRAKYYDWNDLATIDGCIKRGEDIPRTPEERDQLRAELPTRWAA